MPKTFFHGVTPTLGQQITHGIKLWHEAAKKRKIANYEKLFEEIENKININEQRIRDAEFKELITGSDQIFSPGTVMRRSIGNTNPEWWEDDPDAEVVSDSEIRNSIVSQKFSPLKAQQIEMLVLGGSMVPPDAKAGRPIPNEGFFISAHYFAESKSLLSEGDDHSAWVSLTRAYYYLGMNSSPMTVVELTTLAGNEKHKSTESLINLIVRVAASLGSKPTRKPIGYKSAIREVAEIIAKKHENELISYHRSHHGGGGDVDLRSLQSTLENQIQKWLDNPKVHPEIQPAFAPFKSSRGRKPRDSSTSRDD
ncbi:TPA: hypothetical protein UMV36_003924 [Stenotrophomonas maltophilia]|nr:hypothetical protein [Stenotrophomonas maltophilia]MBH1711314.1 hypothetical protein [Stenotrophomonas maltophilia]HEL3759484.1 hypothetical protein [Stenotrophomonas maltophilia]